MAISTDKKKINELLSRGVAEVIDKNHLKKQLLSGKQLRVKLGIDPTSPNLHLGRSIPLLKLCDFQELGHKVVFIVGNFTGIIGDTSDKDSERPMLDAKVVSKNMKEYASQAGKIIDLKSAEVRYNGDWLSPLTYAEIGMQADQFSLAEFVSRENIKKRMDAGKRVSLRELLYPMMQGYDSVAVKADVELGGTDQRFNLLAGRTLQPAYKQKPQDILMTNLILGLDGRKMSSSWGNTINLNDTSRDMFGKIMSMPDNLIMTYFEHCTRVPMNELKKLAVEVEKNPMNVKKQLAETIVTMYYDKNAAIVEKKWFENAFSKREAPKDMPLLSLSHGEYSAIDVVKQFFGAEKSNSDTRRLFAQGAISVNEKSIKKFDEKIIIKGGEIWKVGKRTWFRIR